MLQTAARPDKPREQTPESVGDIWGPAAQMATVGIFAILLGVSLYVCRPILFPVAAALVMGTTIAPLIKLAARRGMPPWLTAGIFGLAFVALAGMAATFLAQPIAEWIARAPEIGATIKQKLYVLDQPLAAIRELQEILLPSKGNAVAVESSQLEIVAPVLSVVTPAVIELVLFFVTLIFFLAAQMDFRRYMVSFFASRQAKLLFMRIANDIEQSLGSYLVTVTAINFGLGVTVAIGTWLFGFPNPLLFGVLAMVLNYIPYIGSACTTLILLGVGLVTFPSLAYAFIPPAAFVGVATIEGQFITPLVLGRQMTLNPLAVLIALAFWSWIWGPMGAFLAVPLTIIAVVTLSHLFPPDESKLPG